MVHACDWDEDRDEGWVAGMRTGMITEFEKMPHKTARKKTGQRAQDTQKFHPGTGMIHPSARIIHDSSWYQDKLDFSHPSQVEQLVYCLTKKHFT